MTQREAAYATLIEPLTLNDVAREIGISADFIRKEIKKGHVLAVDDDRITGPELARYLSSQRLDLSMPLN